MKSYFLDISPQNSCGFCNQIYAILYTCGYAIRNNIQFIFLGKFLKEINTSNYCNISEIINLDEINNFLKNYNIALIDYHNFSFDITEAKYGVGNTSFEITTEMKKRIQNKKFFISKNINLHILFGEPSIFFKDKFFISVNNKDIKFHIKYTINNITFQEIYEQESGYLKTDICYDFENAVFKPSLKISNDCTLFSIDFLRNIRFNNKIILKAKEYIESIMSKSKTNNINCIHLRLEDDAIQHWSKENNMDSVKFKNIIEDKYIEKIKKHINKTDITIILSNNYDNNVVQFLKDNNYNYILTKKMDDNREIAAIYDLLIGQYCNNVYIFINESSFSYTLLFRIYKRDKLKPIELFYVLKQ